MDSDDLIKERQARDIADLNLLYWHLVRREAERNVMDMRQTGSEYRLSARLLQRVTRLPDAALPIMAAGAVLHFELTDPELAFEALETVRAGKPSKKPPTDDILKCHLTRRFFLACRERAEHLAVASVVFRLPIGLVELVREASMRELEHLVGWEGIAFATIPAPPLSLLAEAAELGDEQGWIGPTRIVLGTVFDPIVLRST